jgi:hypothetical protein
MELGEKKSYVRLMEIFIARDFAWECGCEFLVIDGTQYYFADCSGIFVAHCLDLLGDFRFCQAASPEFNYSPVSNCRHLMFIYL